MAHRGRRMVKADVADERGEVETIEAQCRQALSAEVFIRASQDGAALDATAAAEWALELWEEAT